MGLVGIGGKMQIGEQKLALPQHLAFIGLRFLDLDDHVGSGKNLGSSGEDHGTRRFVILIRKACANTCACLDQHLMAMGHGLHRGIGCDADTKLLRFNLFRTSDFHSVSLPVILCIHFAPKRAQGG